MSGALKVFVPLQYSRCLSIEHTANSGSSISHHCYVGRNSYYSATCSLCTSSSYGPIVINFLSFCMSQQCLIYLCFVVALTMDFPPPLPSYAYSQEGQDMGPLSH